MDFCQHFLTFHWLTYKCVQNESACLKISYGPKLCQRYLLRTRLWSFAFTEMTSCILCECTVYHTDQSYWSHQIIISPSVLKWRKQLLYYGIRMMASLSCSFRLPWKPTSAICSNLFCDVEIKKLGTQSAVCILACVLDSTHLGIHSPHFHLFCEFTVGHIWMCFSTTLMLYGVQGSMV